MQSTAQKATRYGWPLTARAGAPLRRTGWLVRICVGLMTAAAIHMGIPAAQADSTLAYYHFEPGANFLKDFSGNGYDLTGTADQVTDVANVSGGTGSAYFNGVAPYGLKTATAINYAGVIGTENLGYFTCTSAFAAILLACWAPRARNESTIALAASRPPWQWISTSSADRRQTTISSPDSLDAAQRP